METYIILVLTFLKIIFICLLILNWYKPVNVVHFDVRSNI